MIDHVTPSPKSNTLLFYPRDQHDQSQIPLSIIYMYVLHTYYSLAALKQRNKQPKYDKSKLQEAELLAKFNASIGGRFHALAELVEDTTDIDVEWNNFTSAVNETATARCKQKAWILYLHKLNIARRKEAKTRSSLEYHQTRSH